MSAVDALLAACLADPDADLPRLALADALDDAGFADRAEFVRAQVALARTPSWEPLAVSARHHRPDWLGGAGFRETLPDTGSELVEWHPDGPFRRGLGGAVRVRQLADLLTVGGGLFDRAPVEELTLPDAPRDHWQAFVQQPWVGRVRAARFGSLTLPIDPLRLLSERPGGVTAVSLQRADSPATTELLGGVVRSPLGRQLTELHLRSGYAVDAEELADELNAAPPPLAGLGLVMMGLTPRSAAALAAGPLLDRVTRLNISLCNQLGDRGLQALAPAGSRRRFEAINLAGCGLGDGAVRWLCWAEPFAQLRQLDLSNNLFGAEGLRPLGREATHPGLRSLALRQCGLTDPAVRHLTHAACWMSLTELDLRFNRLGDPAARHLLTADVPPDLTAVLLTGNPVGERFRAKLRRKYGPAMVFGDETGWTG